MELTIQDVRLELIAIKEEFERRIKDLENYKIAQLTREHIEARFELHDHRILDLETIIRNLLALGSRLTEIQEKAQKWVFDGERSLLMTTKLDHDVRQFMRDQKVEMKHTLEEVKSLKVLIKKGNDA